MYDTPQMCIHKVAPFKGAVHFIIMLYFNIYNKRNIEKYLLKSLFDNISKKYRIITFNTVKFWQKWTAALKARIGKPSIWLNGRADIYWN